MCVFFCHFDSIQFSSRILSSVLYASVFPNSIQKMLFVFINKCNFFCRNWIFFWGVCEYEWVQKWALSPSGLYYTHICLPTSHLYPGWHADSLAVCVWTVYSTMLQSLPDFFFFFILPPFSLLQFSHCLGYLCHGNCATLPAQTQIPPHISSFASSMTQQLLQGFQPPPSLIRHSSFLTFSPLKNAPK